MEYFLLINFVLVILVSYHIGRWNGYRRRGNEHNASPILDKRTRKRSTDLFHPDQME